MAGTSDVVYLRAGALALELVPSIGGSVSAFRHADVDIMRPLSDADRNAGNVLGVAMFPMVPYANRIGGNSFNFRGNSYRFLANNPPEKYNVHGTGWQRPWRQDWVTLGAAHLSLGVDERYAAYQYYATQLFEIDPKGFSVRISVTNRKRETMPFGFGLHPWFQKDADTTIQFKALSFYLEGPDNVAGDPVSLPADLDYSSKGPLPSHWCNNDFGGWDGAAEICFPSRGFCLGLKADPIFRHLMVYADPTKPYFCLEPQSNASGAFNRQNGFEDQIEGIVILEPGQSTGGTVRFDVHRFDET